MKINVEEGKNMPQSWGNLTLSINESGVVTLTTPALTLELGKATSMHDMWCLLPHIVHDGICLGGWNTAALDHVEDFLQAQGVSEPERQAQVEAWFISLVKVIKKSKS